MSTDEGPASPARIGQQALRQLQSALAVAKCIRVAAEYGDEGEMVVADAVAGLLTLLAGVASLLDSPQGAP